MLVLTRKSRESVVVGRPNSRELMLTVTVLEVNGRKVTLGFEGDSRLPVHRSEVWEQILAASQPDRPAAAPTAAPGELDRWDNDGGAAGPMARRPSQAVACGPSSYDLVKAPGAQAATSSHGRDV
jgi:carbon storage regulator CsrA